MKMTTYTFCDRGAELVGVVTSGTQRLDITIKQPTFFTVKVTFSTFLTGKVTFSKQKL